MFEPPPPAVDFDKRWDILLEMISAERGWKTLGERVYPESDDSRCWPVPYTPLEGEVPGTVWAETLSGQVVIVEATYEFTDDDSAVAPILRAAAGWLPETEVVAGRIPNLRDEVFLPLTTIGDGAMPSPTTSRAVIDGGVQAMLAYDDLLARSALAGIQFPAWCDAAVCTAATEVSEGALAFGELARVEDLDVFEPLARQELRSSRRIRRSYVWFLAGPPDDDLLLVPGPTRFDLLESAFDHLGVERTRREVLDLPLRTVTHFQEPVTAHELDQAQHRMGSSWRSVEQLREEEISVEHRTAADGREAPRAHDEVLDIARLFTSAIEKAMVSSKLDTETSSAARHRARHEAVAQHLLDHILHQDDELERMLECLELDAGFEHEPHVYAEWRDRGTGWRFDHVIDDRLDGFEYRSAVIIEDKIDSPLSPEQLDR